MLKIFAYHPAPPIKIVPKVIVVVKEDAQITSCAKATRKMVTNAKKEQSVKASTALRKRASAPNNNWLDSHRDLFRVSFTSSCS
jgi:ribosome-binding protein aMBF1 (putative translation factor)